MRSAIWFLAMGAIAWPEITTLVANRMGIGRGADALLYVFVLAFLASAFVFYARQVRLQRHLDRVVSELARLQPRRGAEADEQLP